MIYLVIIVLIAAIIILMVRYLAWPQDAPKRTSHYEQNGWRGARPLDIRQPIGWKAFYAMSPAEQDILRRLLVDGRAGPELYQMLAIQKKTGVLVVATHTSGFKYVPLDDEDIPEPEQVADFGTHYNCPVFLVRREEMLS